MSKHVQTCPNLFKLVQTCPNLGTFTFLGEPDDNNGADEDEILVDGISRPRNSDSRNGEGLIKLRQFATVPHLPRNVQSRGNFLIARSIQLICLSTT
jgi:hypothetical protein